jgi:lipoate-protein ligase A
VRISLIWAQLMARASKALHHGTMLLDVDPSVISQYLNPSKHKLKSKGVDSVVSRVTNLSEYVADITYDKWNESLIEQFMIKHEDKDINITELSIKEVKRVNKIMEIYEELSQWEWIFGKTPKFTNNIEKKFSWALMDVHFDVRNGIVEDGKTF